MKSTILTIALILIHLGMLAQQGNSWVGKVYSISGSWEITNDHKLILGNDFNTSSGPDLKLYLSPKSMKQINDRDKKSDDWVYVGELASNKGEQTYELPEGTDLSRYKSVIIHCTAYSVVWGGFDLKTE